MTWHRDRARHNDLPQRLPAGKADWSAAADPSFPSGPETNSKPVATLRLSGLEGIFEDGEVGEVAVVLVVVQAVADDESVF